MNPLSKFPSIREVIARHQLIARPSLGQHFLTDPNLAARIAEIAGDLSGSDILEIGPGPGGLTRALLTAGARRVAAVELDRRFAPPLEELAEAAEGRLSLHWQDGLHFEPGSLNPPVKIIANLPYGVASALLARWLDTENWPPPWTSLTLMLQMEVARRLVAQPPARDYGRLSILGQWRTVPKIAMKIRAGAFLPPPKVDSAVVHFSLRSPTVAQASTPILLKVVKTAFGQRRKMIRSSLRSLHPDIESLLRATKIDPASRAQDLSISQYAAISEALRREAQFSQVKQTG